MIIRALALAFVLAQPAAAQSLDSMVGSMLGINPNPASFWNMVIPQPGETPPQEPRPAPELTPEQREQIRLALEHNSRIVDWIFRISIGLLAASFVVALVLVVLL